MSVSKDCDPARAAERRRIGELEAELARVRQRADQLQTIVNNVPAYLSYIDADKRYRFVNRQYEQAFGASAAETVGRRVAEVIGPDNYARVKPHLSAALEGREVSCDLHADMPQVGKRWLSLRFVPDTDGNDRVRGVYALVQDITEIRNAQKALRASRRDLAVRNRIATVFLTVTGQGVYSEVMHVVLDILKSRYGYFGYINDEGHLVSPSLTTDVWKECAMPEKGILFPREQWVGLWGRSLIEKRTIYQNGGLNPPCGHVPLDCALAVPILYHGELIGQFAVANKPGGYDADDAQMLERIADHVAPILKARLEAEHQETARHAADDALRQSEAEFRSLAQWARAGVVIHDAETHIVMHNETAAEILHLSQDGGLGRDVRDAHWRFCREDGSPMPPEEFPVSLVLQSGQPLDSYVVGFDPPGDAERRWLFVNARPVLARAGQVDRVVVTFMDITHQRRIEDQLREAKIAADEANLAKSRFLANMSHELRTPLNAIIGFSDLALKNRQGDAVTAPARYMEHVRQSGSHLLDLINDLLDMAKVDAGKMGVNWEVFPICEQVRSVVGMVMSRIVEKGLRIEQPECSSEYSVRADPRLTRQILLNLLSNAVKYTPEGGRIDICLEKSDDKVRVAVCDTGPGVAPDEKERIFSEFYQVDQVRDTNLGGTGLGLALCRRLTELMGGEIGVESELDRGSNFWFTLGAAEGQGRACHAEDDADADVVADFSGHSVLVVEDNEVNLELVLALLEAFSLDVHVARNGLEALALAPRIQPDLVLMDMRMPEMDGLEATRRLRAMGETSGLPIVALTAGADDHTRREAREAGCDAHLVKPIEIERLVEVLKICLG